MSNHNHPSPPTPQPIRNAHLRFLQNDDSTIYLSNFTDSSNLRALQLVGNTSDGYCDGVQIESRLAPRPFWESSRFSLAPQNKCRQSTLKQVTVASVNTLSNIHRHPINRWYFCRRAWTLENCWPNFLKLDTWETYWNRPTLPIVLQAEQKQRTSYVNTGLRAFRKEITK